MAKLLTIDWVSAKTVPVTTTDDGTSVDLAPTLKAAKRTAVRPALLFVYDGEMKRRDVRKLTKKLFGNEKMAMVTDFFHVVKIASNEKLTPGLHVADPKGRIVSTAHATDKPKAIMKAIATGFEASYEGALDKAVTAYGAYLEKLQAAEDAANVTPSAETANAFKALQKEAAAKVSPKLRKK